MPVCMFVSSHEYIVDRSLIRTHNLAIITHLQYARTTFTILARTPGPGLDFPQGVSYRYTVTQMHRIAIFAFPRGGVRSYVDVWTNVY